MLFNSIEYLIFLPLVVIIYYLLPGRFRWIFLLAASYYFYMSWEAKYAVLILFTTTYNYFVAKKYHSIASDSGKKLAYLSVFVVNLGLLFFFKYYQFLTGSAVDLFSWLQVPVKFPKLNVLLPVGISFYTFQTLSYMIEVRQGKQEVEKHFGYFALYVVYFPQLVAGPIERFSRLTPQLKLHHQFTYEGFRKGLQLILFGLFIKMVIADNLSPLVDQIFAKPADYSSLSLIIGTLFYSIQIYSDFYGYSTIAIGSSAILGIALMDNFRTPYLSKSIAEFWTRWHISLSTWFRDYLFFPLGGSKVKFSRLWLNIFVVFTVSGLWHGANWTFVIWGALHAFYYMIEKVISRYFPALSKPSNKALSFTKILITFILVSFAWIFFRAGSLTDALLFIQSIGLNLHQGMSIDVSPAIWFLVFLFVISDWITYTARFDNWIDQRHLLIRWSVYFVLIGSITALSGVNNHPFIYFQF